MPDENQSVENLREKIAAIIANLEVWASLYDVCDELGLPHVEVNGLGKARYLRAITSAATPDQVVNAARQVLTAYPGLRQMPSATDLENIQDDLWRIESQGVQHISKVTRYRIIESLEGTRFWGRFTLAEFFVPILPGSAYQIDHTVGSDGNLYYTPSLFSLSLESIFGGAQANAVHPSRVSTADLLRKLSLPDWPDQRFCLFLERVVDPEVQPPEPQRQLAEQISVGLQPDGFELRTEGVRGGVPVYKVRKKTGGVSGPPKYIIFASNGPKPDIVINDTVNMDIRVVRNADRCLIYDEPPPDGDLTWDMLVDWWAKANGLSSDSADVRQDFGRRLRASLQSEPEKLLFDSYFRTLRPKLGVNLPALLPQVYLHYDPRSQAEREKPVLVRQRMDFLMLLRGSARIVLEVDGVQHYSDNTGRASPHLYAGMVAEDRRIKLLGYEVYRFGGHELVSLEQANEIVRVFFEGLFARHGISSVL